MATIMTQVCIIVDVTNGLFFDSVELSWVPARTLANGFADQPTAIAFMNNSSNTQYFTANTIYAAPLFFHL